MNKNKLKTNKYLFKKIWHIMVILLLTILSSQIINYTASVYNINYNNSGRTDAEFVLSKIGSRGTEVRNIQKKLKIIVLGRFVIIKLMLKKVFYNLHYFLFIKGIGWCYQV